MSRPINAETLDEVRTLVVRGAAEYEYFFDHLTSEAWLGPLLTTPWFKDGVRLAAQSQTASPVSRYLLRIAERAPQQVTDALHKLLELQDVANHGMRLDILEIGLRCPPQIAARLAAPVCAWMPSPDRWSLPERISKLVAHIVGTDRVSALRLARELLALRPRAKDKEENDDSFSRSEPEPWFEEWLYERILEKMVPSLIEVTGLGGMAVLCDTLQGATREYRPAWARGGIGEDVGLRSIRTAGQGYATYPKGMGELVASIRDGAVAVMSRHLATAEDVAKLLFDRSPRVFRRIVLHFLSEEGPHALMYVRAAAMDKELFGCFDRWPEVPEYGRFLKATFSLLEPEDQSTVLGWLDEPPKWSSHDVLGEDVDAETQNRWTANWKLRRYNLIADRLDARRRAEYEELRRQFGAPSTPDERPPQAFVFRPEPKSPITVDRMRELPIPDVVRFLSSWIPREEEGTANGLAQVLREVIPDRAVEYAATAGNFTTLRREYQSALIAGLTKGMEKRCEADWGASLAVCTALLTGAAPESEDSRWTERTVIEFIRQGLRTDSFARDVKSVCWSHIKRLCGSADPTQAQEAQAGMDPTTVSMNSVRGLSVEAAVQFGLWLIRRAKQAAENREPKPFADEPELKQLLDDHLDTRREPSLAVRSVYARFYPWLFLFDEQWALSRADAVFPLDEGNRDYLLAAWTSYVVYTSAYDSILEPLRRQYMAAVARIGIPRPATTGWTPDEDRSLAQHLMSFMWRGKLTLEDPLLVEFWQKAPSQLRRHTLSILGDAFGQAKGDLPETLVPRAKRLWHERRQAALNDCGNREELASFGTWFASGKFDDEWGLAELAIVLSYTQELDDPHLVLERLEATALGMPVPTLDCLKLGIVKRKNPLWGTIAWREAVGAILAVGLRAGGEAQKISREVVDYLVGLGFYEYRDLLRPKVGPRNAG